MGSQDHFLEMIRLVKAEFIKEMDAKLEKISSQMNQSALRSTPHHPQLMLTQDPQMTGHHPVNTHPPAQQSQIRAPSTTYPGQFHKQQQLYSQVHLPPQAFGGLQEA